MATKKTDQEETAAVAPIYQHIGWWEDRDESEALAVLAAEEIEGWAVVPDWMITRLFEADMARELMMDDAEVDRHLQESSTEELARELLLEMVKANKMIGGNFVRDAWKAAEQFYKKDETE
jgi:hypothetical protein